MGYDEVFCAWMLYWTTLQILIFGRHQFVIVNFQYRIFNTRKSDTQQKKMKTARYFYYILLEFVFFFATNNSARSDSSKAELQFFLGINHLLRFTNPSKGWHLKIAVIYKCKFWGFLKITNLTNLLIEKTSDDPMKIFSSRCVCDVYLDHIRSICLQNLPRRSATASELAALTVKDEKLN